jgi:muramoyltetrapeptide carboxypeptidase
MGFSDVTALLNPIFAKAGFPTVHGQMFVWLGSARMDVPSKKDFEEFLFLNQKGRVLKNPNNYALTVRSGIAEGVLVGGNLCLINSLQGTEYDIDFTDKIVFIEEVEEEPYRLDRELGMLNLAHKLEKAKGVIFGYFSECGPAEGKKNCQSVTDVLLDSVKKIDIPIIMNFASGHDFPFLNLPIGVNVRLDADKKEVTILEEFYKEA